MRRRFFLNWNLRRSSSLVDLVSYQDQDQDQGLVLWCVDRTVPRISVVLLVLTGCGSRSSSSLWPGPKLRSEASWRAPRSPPAEPPPASPLQVSTRTAHYLRLKVRGPCGPVVLTLAPRPPSQPLQTPQDLPQDPPRHNQTLPDSLEPCGPVVLTLPKTTIW